MCLKRNKVYHNTMTGVFVGMGGSTEWNVFPRPISPYSATGASASIASNRISFVLGLQGPSLTIDTACSSALVAVDVASQSLYYNNCDKALVASVNVLLSELGFASTCANKMLSPHGRCATFSSDADGYVRGEGCGAVVMVRKSDVHDHPVYAWLKGSAIIQDGQTANLTSPNGPSQEAVIKKALHTAGCNAEDIVYHESHGTGTSLGDPIEIQGSL